ncbi:DNA-binding transcriptional regulator, LysR family [Selenomonas ruminantium]|uniref:DNA-binding transcriptional regulator, LysR family n=1 Tax=Selenomonas ruminantium TaxID=971 RepID=A0A1I3HGK6_SELRU|nr:LysR family transcriptional regulator [Selenomonas ruminantium]SFI34707.1 DNA-binding transcriptional regulator, LysR family [Selenomonas ruminantium]
MIDEHEWRSVLQVAEDGTFSAAAKHLYVSQPSLSQCIKKIETELGEHLFDRSQTPLQLTPAGEVYVDKARRIQRLKQEIIKETADLSELRTGHLCIGSSRTRSSCYLTQPIIDFHRSYPGIHLQVCEHSLQELKEDVLAGNVDFALLYEPLPDASFAAIPLLKERTLLAVPMDHPLAKKYGSKQVLPYPTLSFARLHKEPFIRLQSTRRMSRIFSELCQQTQCEPDVVFEANSIIDAAELCTAGLGITLVTDMLVRGWHWRKAPFFFELEEQVEERHLVAAYGRNQHLSHAAKSFIALLKR